MELTRAKVRVLRDLQTAGWCAPDTLRCSNLTLSGLFDAGLIEGRSAPHWRGRTTRWRITDAGRIALAGAPPEMHDRGSAHRAPPRGFSDAGQDRDNARRHDTPFATTSEPHDGR